jgi:predicted nucleic acid-binding protein
MRWSRVRPAGWWGRGPITGCTSLACAADATGKLVADAQHAAVAIENGCTLASRDGDFARFEGAGLRWTHLVLD